MSWPQVVGGSWRAVPVLEAALTRYDDTHSRDKALYLTWLTDAYLDAGELEQAVVDLVLLGSGWSPLCI